MADHTGPIIAQRDGLKVVDCENCGYAHLDFLPSAAEVEQRVKGFYSGDNAGWLDKEEQEHRVGQGWQVWYRDLLLHLGKPGKLLDIGCGAGFFLEEAVKGGWRIRGIEANPEAHKRAWKRMVGTVSGEKIEYYAFQDSRGISYGWFPEDLPGSLGLFDAITAILVLEHVLDPCIFLKACYDLLNVGGRLLLVVPNDGERNILQQALRRKHGDWWVAETHINYFTPESLGNLLIEAGFTVRVQQTTLPIELAILLGFDYLEQPELGRLAHEARLRFNEMTEELGLTQWRRGLYQTLVWEGCGREEIIVGEKR